MRLIVKGNRAEAAQAAQERKIPTVPVHSLFGDTQYILACPNAYERKAQAWFMEWRECKHGRGYTTGTLLWYDNEREANHENVIADHENVI